MIRNKRDMRYRIPLDEIHISFARSGGPGGQHVNKTESKVVVRWSVEKSRAFTLQEKTLIRQALASKMTDGDEIVLHTDTERSQLMNKEEGIDRLQTLVSRALVIPKKRRPTAPTFGSVEDRLKTKKQRSAKKRVRKSVEDE